MDEQNTNACKEPETGCEGAAMRYVEQITLNKAGIHCLEGRVGGVEKAIRERYTKDEIDCMLAGKANRCAFEKHLIDPRTHKGRCRPTCCEPGTCNCDCYTKDEIDLLLAEKANIGPPEEHALELASGLTYARESTFYKTQENTVFIHAEILAEAPYEDHMELAYLPVGFRPKRTEQHISYFGPNHVVGGVIVAKSGVITVRTLSVAGQVFVRFSFSFQAAL